MKRELLFSVVVGLIMIGCSQTRTFDNGKLVVTKQDNAFEIKIDDIKMLVTHHGIDCDEGWERNICAQEYLGRSEKDGYVDGYVVVLIFNAYLDDLIKGKINKNIKVGIACFDCKGRDREWKYEYNDLKRR